MVQLSWLPYFNSW